MRSGGRRPAGLGDPSFRPCALRAGRCGPCPLANGGYTPSNRGLQPEWEGVRFRMVLAFGLAPERTIEGPERPRFRV